MTGEQAVQWMAKNGHPGYARRRRALLAALRGDPADHQVDPRRDRRSRAVRPRPLRGLGKRL